MSLGLPNRHWIEKARRQLSKRDPLEALRDVEELLSWAAARADDAIDRACIEKILDGKPFDAEVVAYIDRRVKR